MQSAIVVTVRIRVFYRKIRKQRERVEKVSNGHYSKGVLNAVGLTFNWSGYPPDLKWGGVFSLVL